MRVFAPLCLAAAAFVGAALPCISAFGQSAEKDLIKNHARFVLGTTVQGKNLFNDKTYQRVVLTEFSRISPESELKAAATHPQPDEFTYAAADSLADFAQQNKLGMHGHCLIWHQGLPEWLENYRADSNAADEMMRRHIQTAVINFKDRIDSWDVVAEPFADSNGTLRRNVWYNQVGKGYIAKAFRHARLADGRAKLFLCEKGLEKSPEKLEALLALIKDFKRADVPIDGISLQMHSDLQTPWKAIDNVLRKLTATGLYIHLYELEISVPGTGFGSALKPSGEVLDEQAARYKQFAATYNALPQSRKWGITLAGVHDASSRLRVLALKPDWPTLLNEQYKRKPAYFGFLNALR